VWQMQVRVRGGQGQLGVCFGRGISSARGVAHAVGGGGGGSAGCGRCRRRGGHQGGQLQLGDITTDVVMQQLILATLDDQSAYLTGGACMARMGFLPGTATQPRSLLAVFAPAVLMRVGGRTPLHAWGLGCKHERTPTPPQPQHPCCTPSHPPPPHTREPPPPLLLQRHDDRRKEIEGMMAIVAKADALDKDAVTKVFNGEGVPLVLYVCPDDPWAVDCVVVPDSCGC
jgi:hypothetical protein